MVDIRPSRQCPVARGAILPSLIRFLTVIGIIAALIYGGMFALTLFFDPKPREITVSVPPERFIKQP